MQGERIEAYDDNHWDEGTGLAIAGTAALVAGSAAAISAATTPTPLAAPAAPSQFTTPAATPAPVLAAPCPDASTVQIGDVTYFQCASTWYTLAYGPNGPTYVQSAPPPGS